MNTHHNSTASDKAQSSIQTSTAEHKINTKLFLLAFLIRSDTATVMSLNSEISWQQQLKEAFRSALELHQAGFISDAMFHAIPPHLAHAFQCQIPRYYAELFQPEDTCPIRLQAVPNVLEQDPKLPEWLQQWCLDIYQHQTPWQTDPIGDQLKLTEPRITHRYENRIIVHTTPICALYCRFCFRKHHLSEQSLYDGNLLESLKHIPKTVQEVILTGGDPLSLSNTRLEHVLNAIEQHAHVQHIRIHTRMPVTLPARIEPALIQILAQCSKTISLVSHFNHPREMTPQATQALTQLRKAGVVLYNQAVLMKHINNHAEVLQQLFQTLYMLGVKPFYLHHLDLTEATFGFRVSIREGQQLMQQLAGRLSGPAMPHYVLDVPGAYGKIKLTDARAIQTLETKQDQHFQATLYQIQLPHTRQKPTSPTYSYLDVSSV